MKTKEKVRPIGFDDPVNHDNSANSANSDNPTGIRSAEFELAFVDLQGLDAGLKSRRWNSKLGRSP
jgi:hypothetical protein